MHWEGEPKHPRRRYVSVLEGVGGWERVYLGIYEGSWGWGWGCEEGYLSIRGGLATGNRQERRIHALILFLGHTREATAGCRWELVTRRRWAKARS